MQSSEKVVAKKLNGAQRKVGAPHRAIARIRAAHMKGVLTNVDPEDNFSSRSVARDSRPLRGTEMRAAQNGANHPIAFNRHVVARGQACSSQLRASAGFGLPGAEADGSLDLRWRVGAVAQLRSAPYSRPVRAAAVSVHALEQHFFSKKARPCPS